MSTVNKSVGMAPFHIHLGQLPRMIPPLMTEQKEAVPAEQLARVVVSNMQHTVAEAHDALLAAKMNQAAVLNKHRGDEVMYHIGDMVMLSTNNHRHNLKCGRRRVAVKFLPHWDGPYKVLEAHPETSNYVLELPDLG